MRAFVKVKQSLINHVVLVLDASSSMMYLASELIKVADSQVAYLAQRSRELNQETRITVIVFADEAQCIIWDMDVLRLPSIAEYYKPGGWTALVDGTLLALDDLAMIPEKYGDHAFLVYVLTDGQENVSRAYKRDPMVLPRRLDALPDHWTVAALVPNQMGVHEAKKFGFPKDNIAVWDATSTQGVVEAGATIRHATENFMTSRSVGVRGTRSLFSTGLDAVNDATVKTALTPLDYADYTIIPVGAEDIVIKDFVEKCGLPFAVGRGFYQLTKSVKIQPQKEIVIVEKATNKAYGGRQARDIIGLPDMTVTVKPDKNPLWEIYAQSTAPNRKLLAGTKLLYRPKG
jgi:hypothetical protein